MAYPDNIDSFSTKIDNQDDVMANHINQAQAAIVAVENELGVSPSGSDASVRARLDRIDEVNATANSNFNTIYNSIKNIEYDNYATFLELYYKGYISDIDVTGMKALAFDGWLNKNKLSSTNTSPVYTQDKVAFMGLDANNFTNATTANNVSSAGDYNYGVRCTVNANTYLKQFGFKYKRPTAGALSINTDFKIWDAVNQTLIYSTNINGNAIYPYEDYVLVNLATPILLETGKTYVFGFESDNNDGSNGAQYYTQSSATNVTIGDLTVQSNVYRYVGSGYPDTIYLSNAILGIRFVTLKNNTLKVADKSLSFSATKARLFVTAKTPTNTSITPKCTFNGTNPTTAMTLVGSRPDPKFSGYTEYEYSFDGTAGSTFRLWFDMASTSLPSYPEIKRYGVYFY